MTLWAVVENDEHALAVKRWVQEVVEGLNLCPWAKPADEAGHVRVVTSTATSGPGVQADLVSEALRLPPVTGGAEVPAGQATTTLLCCPYVEAWADSGAFNAFYEQALSNGYLLAKQDLYVVSFHPKFGDYGPPLEVGDVIELGAGPTGAPVRASVLDVNAGYGAEGQRLAKVRTSDGAETMIALPPAGDDPDLLVSWAPRPALHLLRVCDLDRAQDAGLKERNRRTLAKVGASRMKEILAQCG